MVNAMKNGKKTNNLKLIIAALMLVITLLGFGIYLNKNSVITAIHTFQNRRQLPGDLEGWNLSLLMYDSGVDNGMTSIQEDVWNATDSSENRIVTIQVNLSNTALTKDYAPGDLSIAVDSLGKLSPTNESMTTIKDPTTISADLNTKVDKEYDWSYRFDSSTKKFIFTNNNLIEFGTSFESTIQMAFQFSAPETLNGADVTINATLNEELDSINTLNYKFTSNKRPGTNNLTFYKLTSYDGLGDNATDYIWVKFVSKGSYTGSNVRYKMFDSYVDISVPEGCVLLKDDATPLVAEDGIYKLFTYNSIDYSYNSSNVAYIIGFPRTTYEDQTVDLTSNWCGKYMDSTKVKGDVNKEIETIASITKPINLSEFEIVLSGNLYTLYKDNITNNRITYSKIINEQKGEDIDFIVSGITRYDGNNYKARYGDDVLYISNIEGGYTKLTDDEYYFKNVILPGTLYNGNGQTIQNEKYNLDLFVRYRGTDSYVKYGETHKSGTSSTITFNDGEIVVGWYVEIYNLEESLMFSNTGNSSYGFKTKVHIQKSSGIAETGYIYNFDYLQVFNHINGEYVLVNEPPASSYSTTITTEIAEHDIATYGVYLQRKFANKSYGEDYEYYYINSKITETNYDNDFFYRNVEINPYFDNYSTGTSNLDGYNCYLIIPEGVELNATADQLYDLITIKDSTSFVRKSYKPDGTQFTVSEMNNFLKEHLTISIDTNYKNTGKTWIRFKEDFGDITFDTYNTGGIYAYLPIYYNIPVKIPYESYFTHGVSYTFKSYIAPLIDDEPFSYNKSTDTNDIDNDGDTTDFYSKSDVKDTTIVPAISSYQEASKNVWTENTENRYVPEFAVAKNGGNYKYKLKVRTGSNEIKNLMIYDNLENASNDWKGTFVGIDASFTNSQGFNPVLYVSNDRNAGTLESDPSNWRLYDATADNSEVKSVAIDYEDAVIPAGFVTFVLIDMKAPEDPNIKTLAKNVASTKWNAIDLNGNIVENVEGVGGNIVNVGLGKTEHKIIVQKAWEDNDNIYHVRPSSIIVHLLRDNVEIDQIELNDGNNWTHTFSNLRIYDDEYKKYNYTIYEEPVNLYEPSIIYGEISVDTMSMTFKLTNTL